MIKDVYHFVYELGVSLKIRTAERCRAGHILNGIRGTRLKGVSQNGKREPPKPTGNLAILGDQILSETHRILGRTPPYVNV